MLSCSCAQPTTITFQDETYVATVAGQTITITNGCPCTLTTSAVRISHHHPPLMIDISHKPLTPLNHPPSESQKQRQKQQREPTKQTKRPRAAGEKLHR